MAEMGFAATAHHFGTVHTVRVVGLIDNASLGNGLVEAGPTAAAFEFGIAAEKGVSASCAVIGSHFIERFIFARPGAFGSFLAGDMEYIRGQDLFPFLIA